MILDTNAVSALFVGDPRLEKVLAVASRHELPVVVVGEYRYGLARSRAKRTLQRLLDELIEQSTILPVTLATTHAYASVRDGLRAKGTPIPENDVWISALALEHGLEIVSRDTDFDQVEGVRRRGW